MSAPGFADQSSEAFDPGVLPHAPIEFVFEPEARLAIAVHDDAGAPIVGASLEVKSATDAELPAWRGATAHDGLALATRLPAGSFTIATSHAAWPTVSIAAVDVEWGESRSVTITLARLGNAQLLAIDREGAPKREAAITQAPIGAPLAARHATTDAAGIVRFDNLTIGPWLPTSDGSEPTRVEITPGTETITTLVIASADH